MTSASEHPKTLILGLSGPSSSGKTTLARLLREIFNIKKGNIHIKLFIVHEDDFYRTDVDVPWRTWTSTKYGERKLQDWDCVESLDLPLIKRVTDFIKAHGTLPEDFASKEDQNSVGDMHVAEGDIGLHRVAIQDWLKAHDTHIHATHATPEVQGRTTDVSEIRICIVEGFLLFPPPTVFLDGASGDDFQSTSPAQLSELSTILEPNLDLKIFLPCTKELTISRRSRRSGYVTLEGFWEDPPGYVEELVWPNYVRDHAWLFDTAADADMGVVNVDKAKAEKILVGPGQGDQSMKEILQWGVDILQKQIEAVLR